MLPHCYLFSRELNFAKMERAYFAGLKFRDLAKKIQKELNFAKIVKILICINKQDDIDSDEESSNAET